MMKRCWLVLCSPLDAASLWAWQWLRPLTTERVLALPVDSLLCALRWEHRIGRSGVESCVTLPDGTVLESRAIGGVLNRVQCQIPPHWQSASEQERSYAAQEYFALLLSWLAGLECPVLNPPSPQGLGGRLRPRSEWLWLAAQAGLATLPCWQDSECAEDQAPLFVQGRRLLVIGERVLGSAPPEVAAGALRLSRLSQSPLLELLFETRAQGGWLLTNADQWPDLRAGGTAAVSALAAALELPLTATLPARPAAERVTASVRCTS